MNPLSYRLGKKLPDNQGHILVHPASDLDYISHKRWTGTTIDQTPYTPINYNMTASTQSIH